MKKTKQYIMTFELFHVQFYELSIDLYLYFLFYLGLSKNYIDDVIFSGLYIYYIPISRILFRHVLLPYYSFYIFRHLSSSFNILARIQTLFLTIYCLKPIIPNRTPQKPPGFNIMLKILLLPYNFSSNQGPLKSRDCIE